MHGLGLMMAVAIGGAVGAVARHGISELVRAATAWPDFVATMLANLIGCFGIGVAFAYLEGADRAPWVRAVLVTGLLGAFTTFSTFSLDAMHLLHDRKLAVLAAYVTGSVLVGLAAVKLGMFVMAAAR